MPRRTIKLSYNAEPILEARAKSRYLLRVMRKYEKGFGKAGKLGRFDHYVVTVPVNGKNIKEV